MPIGMPGWPELAACTASMARARIAFAMSRATAESRKTWGWAVIGVRVGAATGSMGWLMGHSERSRAPRGNPLNYRGSRRIFPRRRTAPGETASGVAAAQASTGRAGDAPRALRLVSRSLRIMGVRMSCIASSIFPPGTTMMFGRDMNESWIIESR